MGQSLKKLLLKYSLVFLIVSITFGIYISSFPNNFFMGAAGQLDGFSEHYKRIKKNTDNKTTLILGDSTSMYSFEPANDNYIMLNLFSSTYIESFFILKRFLDEKYIPKNIIISTMNFTPRYSRIFTLLLKSFYTDDEILELFNHMDQAGHYPMLNKSFIPEKIHLYFNFITAKFSFFPLFLPDIQDHIYTLGLLNNYVNRFIKNQMIVNKGGLKITQKYGDTKNRFGFYTDGIYPFIKKGFLVDKVYDYYLDKILAIAKEKNIKVYLVEPPSLNHNDLFIKNYLKKRRNYLKSKKGLIHISLDEDFQDTKYFWDDLHLNETGAKKWFSLFEKEFFKYNKD